MVLAPPVIRSLGVAGHTESAAEFSRLATELLGRFGVAGTVGVEGNRVILFGSGPTVGIDAGPILDGWSALDGDARRARALDAARRLAGERRRLTGSGRAPSATAVPPWTYAAVIAAGVLGAGYWRFHDKPKSVPHAPPRAILSVEVDDERERRDRAERVCDATRSRVMRGASVGPSDVEGWVVELAVLRRPERLAMTADPAVGTFLDGKSEGGRIVWPGAGALSALDGPETSATLSDANLPESGEALFRGAKILFTGRYVGAYFDEEARIPFVRFAIAFSEALGVDYAALYARCATGRSHHLGSYFRGPTPGGAVASLLYFIGATADVPDVRRSLLSPVEGKDDPAFAFRSIASATAALKKTRVMAMLGAHGGMIAGLDGEPSTIGFPPKDANRAARASHEIARDLGIGENR